MRPLKKCSASTPSTKGKKHKTHHYPNMYMSVLCMYSRGLWVNQQGAMRRS